MPKQRVVIPNVEMPPKVVEVEWLDAAIHPDYDGDAKGSPGRVTLLTVGYYVKKTGKDISLAVDYDPELETFRTPSVIRRGDITRFTPMAASQRRRK
jgi:hypothetical protein